MGNLRFADWAAGQDASRDGHVLAQPLKGVAPIPVAITDPVDHLAGGCFPYSRTGERAYGGRRDVAARRARRQKGRERVRPELTCGGVRGRKRREASTVVPVNPQGDDQL